MTGEISPPAEAIGALAPEVVAYVDGEIEKLKGTQRCYASAGLAAAGLILALIGVVAGASVEWTALGVSVLSSGSALVAKFCPG